MQSTDRKTIPREAGEAFYELGYAAAVRDLYESFDKKDEKKFFEIVDFYFYGAKHGTLKKIRPADFERFARIREGHYEQFEEREREKFRKQEEKSRKANRGSIPHAEKFSMGGERDFTLRIS